MQPVSGNQRPDLLTALTNMSLECIFADRLQMSHACHRFWTCYKTLTFCSPLTRCTILRLPRETTSERQKVVRACGAFKMFTSKCAPGHNCVHFFNISASKSGPDLVCCVHFDFEMCFAPQQRALFHHRNFKKWSEPVRFLRF